MKPPIFVRSLSQEEREALTAGLRSKDAFVMRRSQILVVSSRGESPPRIARSLGCGSQTVRNAIHTFNERGLDALTPGSSRPKRVHAAFDRRSAETLREMLHRSPREFGYDSSLWTLEMAAAAAFAKRDSHRSASPGRPSPGHPGAPARGSMDAGQARWITSPDPLYERKKGGATG